MENILRPLALDAHPGFFPVLSHIANYGSKALDALTSIAGAPTNIYIVDSSNDDPRYFINQSFSGLVDVYGAMQTVGSRLVEMPDQEYLIRHLYPLCGEMKNTPAPMAHFIRAYLNGHAVQYRRLITPMTADRSGTSFLSMTWVDYCVSMPMTLTNLTDDERNCLLLVADGHSAKSIASQKGVSQKVIERRIESARRKLGARNTAHAVAIITLQQLSLPES